MSNEVAFANWWATEMKGIPCPPVPRKLSELSLTAQMSLRATKPELYTALFAGGKEAPRLPADVSVRLNSGQLQPGDASALRAAGFEVQALHCERLGQAQQDQQMADQISHGRQVYEQAMQRNADWQSRGILERMAHEPLSQEQIQAYRRQYGVSGK